VGSLQSVLIIPDSHLPDHDPEAMDLALEVGSYLGISAIYFLGVSPPVPIFTYINYRKALTPLVMIPHIVE